jgi:hypothetical protein
MGRWRWPENPLGVNDNKIIGPFSREPLASAGGVLEKQYYFAQVQAALAAGERLNGLTNYS